MNGAEVWGFDFQRKSREQQKELSSIPTLGHGSLRALDTVRLEDFLTA
jgi:hypothetical protein